MTWDDLKWKLEVAGRPTRGTLPSSSSSSEWAMWASANSRPVRFRGRDGWRSTGPLDSLLKRMSATLQSVYQAPDSVYGFVPNRSTFTAAQVHIGAKSALTVDLKDFFGQITEQRVRRELASVLDAEALNVFVACCLRSSSLPLGFRTSPIISNLVFLETDLALEKLCDARSVEYSRWVDDLVFSGSCVDDSLLAEILAALHSFDWVSNEKKTRFMSKRRVVLGLNIAEGLERPHVPRGIKKELRKQVYFLNKFGLAHFSHATAWPLPRILGMIAYVKSVDPNLAALLEQQLVELPNDPRLAAYSRAVGGGKWQMSMLRELGL